MKKTFLDKRIPTLLGLFLIITGIILTTYLVKTGNLIQTQAGPSDNPKNVTVSNISDNSFTVSYITDGKVIGTVSYGEDASKLDSVALDDRDQVTQSINKYTIHSITIRDLKPQSSYYFSITSGETKYLNNNSPFNVSTGSEIGDSPPSQDPMTGKTILPDGSAPAESLVYVTINGAQNLSTITKSDGTYTIPLNNLRNQSMDDYFILEEKEILNIDIYTSKLSSSVSVSANQINPVPIITLSNSYDFSTGDFSPKEDTANQTGSFPDVGKVNDNEPKIITPENNEKFSDQQPKFEGTGQPNETVEIEIHSDENIRTETTTGSNGIWSYRHSAPLSPGNHTITIKTKNKQGIIQTITQNFVVFASGDQVEESATPSATLTPTISPVVIAEITETASLSPEISPLPTLPPTGPSSVIIAAVAAAGAVGVGLILYLLSRENPL
ncbi:MAG: Ig-like domain-containing protein [Patescibacteria group bacterium]